MTVRSACVGTIAGLVLLAACGGTETTAVPTTTSTTLAISLPADQVSQQARGIISLDDLGTGWKLSPAGVNNFATSERRGGTCSTKALQEQVAGYDGRSQFLYLSTSGTADLTVSTWVFPNAGAARSAYSNIAADHTCPTGRAQTMPSETIAVLANPDVGDESAAWQEELLGSLGVGGCGGLPLVSETFLVVRRGATVSTFSLMDGRHACANPLPNHTQETFEIAKKADTKLATELKSYTRAVYAAKTTSSTKP